jgi:hypothetical protein
VITWHVYPGELRVYRNGELIGTIPRDQWGELIYRLAAALRG